MTQVFLECHVSFAQPGSPLPHLSQGDSQVTPVPVGTHPAFRAFHELQVLSLDKKELVRIAIPPLHSYSHERAALSSHTRDAAVRQPHAVPISNGFAVSVLRHMRYRYISM